MMQTCFAATGPGHLAAVESPMNSSVYQSILKSRAKAWLKLDHQQDNNAEHRNKFTTECLKNKRTKVLK